MDSYLDLFKGDFKAKGLVVIRVEGVLLDCRLLLLQPLAVLHQVDLCVRICREAMKRRQSVEDTNLLLFSTSDLLFHRLDRTSC